MSEADLDMVSELESDVAAFPWTRGHFADCLKAGYSAWVLKVGEVIAGYAVLMMALDEGHLLNIGIATPFQHRGLGARLLEHVLARTRQSGGVSLLLEVRPSNDKALALYQRYGFGEIGRRKAYYPAHLGREDALVLRRALEDQT
jgi:ribosomal-protein-alanine acetyltransferase